MTTIRDLARALRASLLEVEPLARKTGFVQRRSKLTGVRFVGTLVFGWLADPDIPLAGLCQVAALLGAPISPQGLEQRFTPQATDLLRQVLEQTLQRLTAVRATPCLSPLLQRFPAVYLTDCTTVALPDAFATASPGCGNASTPAAASASLKAVVRLELRSGQLSGPSLGPGRPHDRAALAAAAFEPAQPGALELADLGFFSLARFASLSLDGVHWLSRLQIGTVFFEQGQRHTAETFLPTVVGAQVDVLIALGAQHRLPARLVAVRVPPEVARERRRRLRQEARRRGQPLSRRRLLLADWTILVTSLSSEQASVAELLTLYGTRWQIELLFKLWKSGGGLARSRSAQPQRILCEIYAKLLGMVVQHGILVVCCWAVPDRSLPKTARTIRLLAVALAQDLPGLARLEARLRTLRTTLSSPSSGCRLAKRRGKPSTFQRLLAVEIADLSTPQAA